MDAEEKNRKRKALITALSVQLVVLLICYFIIAWRPPDPPNPEYGIELNFGLEQVGSGSQPVQSPNPTEQSEVEQNAAESAQESPQNQDGQKNDTPQTESYENENADVSTETNAASSKATEESNQPDTDPETTDPASTNPAAEYNPSQGDQQEGGDQGDPDGDINEEALYGNDGGGEDGSSLQMSGWRWDAPPKPQDTSNETGKIVYEIVVDSDGYLISYKILTSTVSPAVARKYSEAVEDLTFLKTSSYKPAPSSKGKITFIIRSK